MSVCRQCNGEKRLLSTRGAVPAFVACPLCRGSGESNRKPVKPNGATGTIHEPVEAHWQRNGGKW